MLALVCCFGGPLVNKLGVKWSLVIGAATFPIRGASYYVNSKYGNQWVSPITGFEIAGHSGKSDMDYDSFSSSVAS